MKTAVIKRSITIGGGKTSISLEDEFWYGLLEIAVYKQMTVPTLIKRIDHSRKTVNLFIRNSHIRFQLFQSPRRKANLKSASCAKLVQT
ncbi:MAG: ribbon-helix-helix domain-containing protein [Pseudolabrys sp.]|jgi:predicted DNA-binding ribbon-helix-helix protein